MINNDDIIKAALRNLPDVYEFNRTEFLVQLYPPVSARIVRPNELPSTSEPIPKPIKILFYKRRNKRNEIHWQLYNIEL